MTTQPGFSEGSEMVFSPGSFSSIHLLAAQSGLEFRMSAPQDGGIDVSVSLPDGLEFSPADVLASVAIVDDDGRMLPGFRLEVTEKGQGVLGYVGEQDEVIEEAVTVLANKAIQEALKPDLDRDNLPDSVLLSQFDHDKLDIGELTAEERELLMGHLNTTLQPGTRVTRRKVYRLTDGEIHLEIHYNSGLTRPSNHHH